MVPGHRAVGEPQRVLVPLGVGRLAAGRRGRPLRARSPISASTGANAGTDAGVQCTKIPSLASFHQAGTRWRFRDCRSDRALMGTDHAAAGPRRAAVDARVGWGHVRTRRCRGGRGRAQRPGGGADVGPRRLAGPGPGAGRHPRRRHPHPGADPARVPPRRVLRHPPAGHGVPRVPGPGPARRRRPWIQPDVPLAHALRPGHSVLQERSLERTADRLGDDGRAWTRLFGPSVDAGLPLVDSLLQPLSVPHHPVALARYGLPGIRSASSLGRSRFRGDDAPALLAGLAAHSMLSLDAPITGGFGMLLGQLAHVVGWPMPEGGSQAIADALVALIEAEGGEVRCGHERPGPPRAAGGPGRAVRRHPPPAARARRRPTARPVPHGRWSGTATGPGVFKVDWALDGPVPVDGPRDGRGPAPCTSAARWPRCAASEEDVVRGRAPRAAVRPAGPAVVVRPHPGARRQAHRSGPTATCPTAPTST